MNPSRVVIKLGGASLQDPQVIDIFAQALIDYKKYGYEVIVVHGGGPAINEELTRRQIKWNFHQGLRVTTPEMIDVIEEVLQDKVNSSVVKSLAVYGIEAQGLGGYRDLILLCRQASPELGLVGNVLQVNTEKIVGLLPKAIPVISTIGYGEHGEKYNINADWAASQIASALKAKYLIFLTDQFGILDHTKRLLPTTSISGLHSLITEEVVTGGMLTKTQSIISAIDNGVEAVRVMNGKDSRRGLWSDQIGTWCRSEAAYDSI